MSTIRLARILNTAISFFSKKAAGARKGILLAVMGACAWGAWGDEEWSGTYTEKNVTTENVKITLTGNTTIEKLWIHALGVVIDLAGYKLDVTSDFYLGGANTESGTTNASVTVTDSSEYKTGLLTIENFDAANNKTILGFILEENVTVSVTGEYWLDTSGNQKFISGTGFFDVSKGTNKKPGTTVSSVVTNESKDSIRVYEDSTGTTGIETTTYYWTGAVDNKWTTSTNWAANPAGTPVKTGTYPGHVTGETAVFTAGVSVNLDSALTVSSLNVDNSSSSAVTLSAFNCGSAAVTFNGKFSSSGTFTCGSDAVSFNGDFTSTGTFTASSGNTYFLGNADFSSCTIFNANSGKIYFYNAGTELIQLKTPGYNSASFNEFYFAGDVELVVTNTEFSCSKFNMEVENPASAGLTKSFTAKVSGSSMTAADCYITRCAKETESGVYGTLEIDSSNFTFTKLNMRSGTNLIIDSSSTATIGNFQEYSTDALGNSITVKGNLSASSLSFSANSSLTVNSGGQLSATDIKNLISVSNSGTIKLTGGSSEFSFTSYTGASDNTDTVESAGGAIIAKAENPGIIGTLNLTSGTTTLGYASGVSSSAVLKLGDVGILDGASLSAGSDFSVSGSWINNPGDSGFTHSNKTVTFTGDEKSLVGNTTFYKAVFTNNIKFSGNNTYTEFLCETGGITLTFGISRTQTVTGNLTLIGGENNPLSLSSTSLSSIIVPSDKFSGEYLSIGKNVEIKAASSVVPGAFVVSNSSCATGATFANIYAHGWNLSDTVYKWIGTTNSWKTASNWDMGVVPDSIAIVEYSGTETAQPVLDVDVEIKQITIPADKTLSLNGRNFTVSGEFSNSGTVILKGTETVALPTGKVTENGTWHYHGEVDGTGTVKAISNLSYKKLVLSGSLGVASGYEVTASDGIVLGTNSETVTITGTTSFGSAVTLVNDATIGGNNADYTVRFKETVNGGKALSLSGGYIFFYKNVGGTTPLASIACTIAGTLVNDCSLSVCGASVKTSGNQSYNGGVQLYGTNKDVATSAGDSSFISTSGSILFGGVVFNDGATGAANHAISVSASSVTFSGSVGTQTNVPLASIEVNADSIEIQNAVKCTGIQSYNGAVTIAGDSALASVTSNQIDFSSKLTIDTGKTLSLGGTDDTYSVSVSGDFANSGTLLPNKSSITFRGVNAEISGNSSFHKTVFTGNNATISGNNTFTDAIFTANATFSGNNTFTRFTCETGGITLTFAPDTTQTVSEKLTLRGGEGESNHILLTGNSEWNITPADDAEISVAYVTVKNSKNTRSEPIIVYAKDGFNTDGTGNTNWFFAGQEYVWTGADSASSTEWNSAENWAPKSVPTKYSDVKINAVASNKYPVLTSAVDLANNSLSLSVDSDGDGTAESVSVASSVTIGENVIFDFNGKNLTVNTLKSEGRIRVLGTETLAASGNIGIVNFPVDENSVLTGIIEYYGDYGTALNWGSKGNKYKQLEFTSGAKGSVAEDISVTGDALIANGSGNAISLTGANSFGGTVTIDSSTGDITLSGNNTFAGGVSIISGGNIVLNGKNSDDEGFSLSEISGGSCTSLEVRSSGSFTSDFSSPLTFTGDAAIINGNGKTFGTATFNGNGTTLNGNNTFTEATFAASATLTGANTFGSLSFTGAGSTITFAAGKTQTVTGSLSSIGGSGDGEGITLTTDAPLPSAEYDSTWWILNIPEDKGKAISADDFKYTKISYSKSLNDIVHEWASSVSEAPENSSLNWFSREYFWIGGTDESTGIKWEVKENWRHKTSGGDYFAVRNWPSYAAPINEITISSFAGNKNLVLENDVSVKSLTVETEKSIDLKGYSVTASDSDSTTTDFVNNGTVRLWGANNQISSSVENGDRSTVEYYREDDDSSVFSWGNAYENLNILGAFAMSEDVSVGGNLNFGNGAKGSVTNKFSVTGTTSIANGSTNAITLTGENSFGGAMTIGTVGTVAGDITLNGNNTFAGGVEIVSGGNIVLNGKNSSGGGFALSGGTCNSLEVRSSVTFESGFSSPLTFTGAGAIIDGNGKSFGIAIFSGNGATLNGDNTFSDAIFAASTTFSGDNTFTKFTCSTAGITLTFADGTTQTINEKLTLRGGEGEANHILLNGNSEWNIKPAANAEISVAYVTVNNSKNTRSEPIIVYAKDGFNTDGTGNTNWFFAGQEYVWTGADSASSTEWNSAENWVPKSVPSKYSDVKINALASKKYPVLTSDVDLANDELQLSVDLDGDGTAESISVSSSVSIGENVIFDFNGKNLTVNTLKSDGRIRVQGSETLDADLEAGSGIVNFPVDENSVLTGIIEYYGDYGTALNWGSKGNKYKQLEFTSGAKGSVAEDISVTGDALIANGSGNAISLTGANKFGGLVTIGNAGTAAGDITLSGDNTFASGVSIVSGGNIVLNGKNSDDEGFSLSEISGGSCTSLEVRSSVSFTSDFSSPLTFTGVGATINGNGNEFGMAIFNGSDTKLNGDNNFTGAASFNSTATLSGNNIFSDATFAASATLSGANTFTSATFSGSGATVIFSDANTFDSLSFTGAGSTVKFAAGKAQTVNESISSIGGSGAGEEITLTTDSDSPSLIEGTWWILDILEEKGKAIPTDNFKYTKISYSKSVNDIAHAWDSSVSEGIADSTDYWFFSTYYWLGLTDSDWDKASNWGYINAGGGFSPVGQSPSYSKPKNRIHIVTDTSGNDLVLSHNISVRKLAVESEKKIDLRGYSVTASDDDSEADFVNYGMVRLWGADGQISSSVENGSGSTVEYYREDDSTSVLSWGNAYENLNILGAFEMNDDVTVGGSLNLGEGSKGSATNKFTVTGTTSIANGSTNAISLTGDNTFAGGVEIVSGGNIILNGKNSTNGGFVLSGGTCSSLEVRSSVSFASDFSSPITFTGVGATIDGNGKTFGTATFSGNGATLNGNNTFSGVTTFNAETTLLGGNSFDDAIFAANTTFSGNNTFTKFTCSTGGITLTFANGTSQTINGVPNESSVPLTLKGTSDSRLSLSGSGIIIVPKNTEPAVYSDFDWLSIGADVKIKASADGEVFYGSHKAYSGSEKTSVPSSGDYVAIYKNGWDLGEAFAYTWTGDTNSLWCTPTNWDIGMVPGISNSTQDTRSASVTIPDGKTNYPEIDESGVSVGSLEIGASSESAHDSSINLTTNALSVTGKDTSGKSLLTNYGTIEYSGTARITDGTNAINDVANGGTVLYSGGTSGAPLVVTDFYSSGADYANLVISDYAQISEDLTLKGNFSAKENTTITAASGKTFVLTGDSAQNVSIASGANVTLADFAISGNKSVNFNIASGATASLTNFSVSGGASVTSSGNFGVAGSWTNTSTAEHGFTAADGKISFTGAGITVSGNNIFNDADFTGASVTLSGNNTFNDATFTGTSVTVSGDNEFHAATFPTASASVTFTGTNTFTSATFSGAGSGITFSGENTFGTLAFTGEGSTVKFAAGKIQTVNGSLTSTGGSGVDGKITLASDSSAPSVDDETTWWAISMPNFDGDAVTASFPAFTNTKISYSKSEPKVIAHDWGAGVFEGERDSTRNWFLTTFYWYGTADSSWQNSENWRFTDSDTADAASFYPSFDYSGYTSAKAKNDIIIATGEGSHDLVLAESVQVKNLTVRSGKSIDLKGHSVTASDSDSTTADFVNNGTVRLLGETGQISSSVENGSGSMVEYYRKDAGNSVLSWGSAYENLNILGAFAMSEDVSVGGNLNFGNGAKGSVTNKFSVTGTTSIANGSTNAITLTGANFFGGTVTIGTVGTAAGDITLSGNNTFTNGVAIVSGGNIVLNGKNSSGDGFSLSALSDNSCTSLEVRSSVTFASDFSSPLTFTGVGATIDGNGKTFGTATFSGNGATLNGDNTFTGVATFNAETSLSGGNTFADAIFAAGSTFSRNNTFTKFTCTTGGVMLTFAHDTNQTVNEKLTLRGEAENHIFITGESEWNITPPADDAGISIAYVTVKNSHNTREEPIIVYAKDGFNTDGTGNTNWFFAGQEYVWTGADENSPTEWNSSENWNPKSVPTKYSDVKINAVFSKKYPVLTSDVDLANDSLSLTVDLDGDGTPESVSITSSVAISENVIFDFNGKNLTVNSLTSDGRIRVSGNEILEASGESGIVNFPVDENSVITGIIEYYGDFGEALNWGSKGNKYKQLEFTSGAKGSVSDNISVMGTTLIANGSENAISLTGDNSFGGGVTIGNSGTAAGNITLSGGNTFTGGVSIVSGGAIVIKGEKDSGNPMEFLGSSSCGELTVESGVVLNGNVTTEGSQIYKGDVVSAVSGLELASNSSYILASGTEGRKWSVKEGGSLRFASDVFVDLSSATLTLETDLDFKKNLVLYSGKISAGDVKLSIEKDLVLFGSSYSASDPRFSGTNTRFAYYGYESSETPLAYNPESETSGFAGEFDTNGTKITVGGNFYANGLNLADCNFFLLDNSGSKPVFNSSSSVTKDQWGLPYAVVFNSTVSNCKAQASGGSVFVTAAAYQGVIDGSNSSGFQFKIPKISGAYSVSDSVICLSFDMDLENSNREVQTAVAMVTSLMDGGVFYNGGTLAFDGFFYTKTDGTDCSVPLSESAWASSDIPAGTPLYLKVSSPANTWNTDATASSKGNDDSSDRSGAHRTNTIDLSLFEGLFYAADGKTMSRNYGVGLWKEESESSYSTAKAFPTIDMARPVLVDVFTGQELHSTNIGSAESQKVYDSHNFIEFRYSEPVDIGDMTSGAETDNQNIRAENDFDSASSHGGAISKNGTGLSVAGFASIAEGSLMAGFRDGDSHKTDTAKPHALYRKFSRSAISSEEVQPCRIRISVAGFVDTESPYTIDGKSFNNWVGYIDSSETPSGTVTPLANSYITDLAKDSDGNLLKNTLDENNSSREIEVNSASSSISSDCEPGSLSSLYGSWDCTPPSFAPYITSADGTGSTSWNEGDNDTRTYEIVGMVESNTSAYLEHVEFHLFDNQPEYKAGDEYKWVSQFGWYENGSKLDNHLAPETTGGGKPYSAGANMTSGGIRRSSLSGAREAFEYSYSTDENSSSYREFGSGEIFQHVKSSLYRSEEKTSTSTDDDGLYIALYLNETDSKLPMRTGFTVKYYPEKSFITDLAGNRLVQTDDGTVKTLHSVDITPPSFSIVLSPIGEKKIYMVFTKSLAYGGVLLQDRADLDSVLEKIRSNIEFVYSEDDDIDTTKTLSGDDVIEIEKVELASYSTDYTSLLFTLDRNISLNDVEKIWLRINGEGDEVETFASAEKIVASYFRDTSENSIPYHTCHSISDFAVNAVNVLYARSSSDDGWDEHEIYGAGLAPTSSDYAAHDFSADGANYAKLRSGHDIIFQLQLVGGVDSDGYYGFKNDESLALVIDKKSNLRNEWISDKFNLLTKKDWRIWLDKPLPSLASSYNSSPLSRNPVFEKVTGSDLLENMTLKNDEFNFASKEEYQFFFKILDKDGNPILINHDGDKTTQKIPLYALWMPQEKISSGDFSFLDLWSFTLSSITRQRGGVTILNNVIDASVGEKTAIEVDMAGSGNLNVFIMTLDGNVVQHLAKGSFKAGKHYFYWDGKNKGGSPVARGLYFVRVSGKGIDETRKVMVVK